MFHSNLIDNYLLPTLYLKMEEKQHCLICYQEDPDFSAVNSDDGSVIRKQLDMVFILRKLLEIPAASLEKYLEASGGNNPDSWAISLCAECEDLVGKGRRLFEQMVSAWRRFKTVQEQVVEKVRASRSSSSGIMTSGENFGKGPSARRSGPTCFRAEKRISGQEIGRVVTEECRKFVCECDYGALRNPFPFGDLDAERMLSPEEKDDELLIKQEPECQPSETTTEEDQACEQGYLDDGDDDWTLPRSPLPVKDDTLPSPQQGSVRKPMNTTRTPANSPRRKNKRLIDIPGAYYREDGKVCFRCPVPDCAKVYEHKRNYLLHKSRHTGEFQPVPCDICGKQLASIGHVQKHKKFVHDGIPRKQNLTEKKRLEIRMRYQQKCPHCDLVTDKYTLARHIQNAHESSRTIFCEICGKDLGNKRLFREHQAEAHGICSVEECKVTFTPGDREGLRNHQLEAHGREVDVFRCEDCGKLFRSTAFLKGHQYQVHFKGRDKEIQDGDPGSGEWVCHQCGKQFARSAYLTRHVSSHQKNI